MGFIAIVGSGALGGAVAHALALRDRISEIRLIDDHAPIASGKALDIQQSSPIDGFSARVTAAGSISAAVGADVIVIAGPAAAPGSSDGEHAGEPGLALLRQLTRAGATSPIVCAGATQNELIGRAITELHLSRSQVLGSATVALEAALRALTGVAVDGSGADVSLHVVGVPPRGAVVAWETATAFGQPLSSLLPAHEIAALGQRIPSLWPPGPYVLASAAAQVVEAIVLGSRRRFSCLVALDAGPRRAAVCAMPVHLGPRGVVQVLEPSLTRQERTMMENALERNQ